MTNEIPSFVEVTFPESVSYGFSGGPEFVTDVQQSKNGYEQRNIVRDYPLSKFTVAFTVKSDTAIADLRAFFLARRGRAQGFRFKDWADYKIIDSQIGIGTGEQTQFQISKLYRSGGMEFVREIYKIVRGTLTVTVDGVTKSLITDYLCDFDSGIITFSDSAIPAKGKKIKVTCEFDVPVRFDTDQIQTISETKQSHSWQAIPIVEIRDWQSKGYLVQENLIYYVLQENGDRILFD